jgi:RND family efflux transporter MFP subunit
MAILSLPRLRLPKHILPFAAIAALLFAVLAVAATQPDREMTAPGKAPPTAPQSLSGNAVSGSGLVEPSSELIEVGTQRPGVVTRLYVRAGDRVTKGQPLFTIDARDARAQLGERSASVRLAQERADAAAVELATANRLYSLYANVGDERAVAEQQVIERRNARDSAAARLEVARAELRQAAAAATSARTAVGLLEVRAPQSGTVLQVNTRVGQYATAGPGPGSDEPLILLGETNPLHVRVDIDENEIGRVAIGQGAIVSPRGNAGVRAKASFVRAEPLIVPKRSLTNSTQERVDVRVLQLIFALPPTATQFFVGQQVDAFVPAQRTAKARL